MFIVGVVKPKYGTPVLFIIEIMSYNPITLFLTNNKLTRPNYVDWKTNLEIALTKKQLKWVTQELAPPILNGFSMQED